jgi:arsenate reductase
MNAPKRYRTLFVCIGNSCRSPMAEAIANARYADVIDAFSAGLGPAPIVQALTFSCLRESDVKLDPNKRPQELAEADWKSADLIVNMSGHGVLSVIPDFKGDLLIWEIPDPIGQPMAVYRIARDLINRQVGALADALRHGTRLPGL